MNSLWASRLSDLVQKHEEIEAIDIKRFFLQTTKEERVALKQLCSERPDLKAVNHLFVKIQKQVSGQKLEISELKYQSDLLREDYETVELMNKVKE